MNNFTMETFNSGEAFDEPAAELARILRELADRIEAAGELANSGRDYPARPEREPMRAREL
jgi:hypothetical protein